MEDGCQSFSLQPKGTSSRRRYGIQDHSGFFRYDAVMWVGL